jgi:hypothetical protein
MCENVQIFLDVRNGCGILFVKENKYDPEKIDKKYNYLDIEGKKFHSNNLYQLYSYLRNIETKLTHKKNIESEGILLYPALGYQLNENFILGTHKLSVKTIDLSKSWREIEKQLYEIIGLPIPIN